MRGQKITSLGTALAQADRLCLLLHQAANRQTGASREEVEAVAALAAVLAAVLKKVPDSQLEAIRQARAAATATIGLLEQGDTEFATRWARFTKKLLGEALGEPWETEAEAWLRRQLDGLGRD